MSIATERLAQVSVQVGNQEITFETGKLAKQADGAVVVRSGETMVLATAVGRTEAREGADFFPLTIDVEERMYAAGKIPGGFFKREGTRERARHPDRTHDRPPDPAAVAEGLPQRGAGHLHRPFRRPRHAARHPVHQRRLGGADDLAAAVLRPRRRRSHRPDRRRARRQPDAAAELERDVARPDRRRHEGRPDDGRGRRRRGARGRAARGARDRPRRDQASSARRRRSCAARPASRSGSTSTSRPRSRRRTATRSGSASRASASARRPPSSTSCAVAARRRDLDGLDRGGHPAPDAGTCEPAHAAREAAARRRRRARCASSSRAACGR